ncbi:neurotrypsin [Patella vulgata]|uniref:neurotrypsin n=1 Tax=Patella vulgata TaxID=6465 RepID=UPI0024A7AA04|nr:neurotrypsin [Patella vulgata]
MVGGVTMFARTGSLNPMVSADFSCTGKEHKLENCPQDRKGFQGCPSALTSGRAAGIRCYNSGGTGIRLLGGGRNYGRLELKFGNTWGRVCNWMWDNNDATVACKQLGFHSGFAKRGNYSNGLINKNALITRSSCDGTEESLYQCKSWWNPPIEKTQCADAGVICHNTIRLINGNYISAGSIGVNINGIWGTVCDHNWSDQNTAVACKELGYDNGVSACCSAYGNQPIAIMENVQCKGSESRLVDCSHEDPQTHSCFQHSVAVICFNGKKSKAFTWNLGGGNNYTGEVIVNYLGTPGSICSDDWDDNDARVACRELGYRNGTAYNHVRFDYYFSSNGPYWISKLACNGSEGNLAECAMSMPLGGVTRCSSMRSAGIFCSDNVDSPSK